MCTSFHSSSSINGCVAVTSTGFQVKCSARVVAGDREKEGRIVFCSVLSAQSDLGQNNPSLCGDLMKWLDMLFY